MTQTKPTTVAVIPCPFSGGQPRAGVNLGPEQLVSKEFISDLKELGYTVDFPGLGLFDQVIKDLPDDPPIGKLLKPRLVSNVTKELARVVQEQLSQGNLALTLGGDHSLAMGTVSGTFAAYPDACLVWVDAHADLNTPESTPSGNMHGVPLSFLLGLEGTDIPEFAWIKPVLKSHRLVYIGLRDIDPGEKRLLREKGIRAYSMHEIDKYGIGQVVEMALDHVNPKRDLPIHLSFDVDAMDPSVAKATGTPVRGGLTFREGHYICEAVAQTGRLVSLDMMEVNPTLGNDLEVEQTVAIGRSLVLSALGETLL